MNSTNWQIEEQCPQCGAPVSLGETDRILSCAFCRTHLYITTPDYFRYCIPPPAAAAEEILYVPYWRLRGLSYTFEPAGMTNRYVDTNTRAIALQEMPPSLGLRPQAMKLRFASPESKGVFLKPSRTLHDALPETDAATIGTHHGLFVGGMVSLIHTPMVIKNGMLCDAILQRPVAPWHPENISALPAKETIPATQFTPALCPQCNWDLKGEKDALVLSCANCNSSWICEGGAFRQIPCMVIRSETDARSLLYLPFWRIKPRLQGLQAASFADFIRLANLPRAITPTMEEKPLFFWSPAFKLNPALFLRWFRQMTIFQPEDPMEETAPGTATYYPVNLPLSEATEGILAVLGSTVTDKRMFYQNLPFIKITPDDFLLVYHPFVIDQREFRHEKMGLVIEKNALLYGATM